MTSENERGSGDVGSVESDELAVEESELHDESRNVLSARIFERTSRASESEPSFSGRVTDDPVNRCQYMTLHLNECLLVVSVAAHLDEFRKSRHTNLSLLELCGDPQCGTTNELIVFLEDDTLRDVSVDDIESEVESFGAKSILKVNLDEKVDEVRPHVPPEFRLLIDEVGVRHRLGL